MSSPMLNRRNFLTLGTGMATLMAQGALHGSVAPGQKHLRRAKALGTKVKFTVFHPEQKRANRAIDAALDKIEHVEQLMSLYRTDSQLSLLNRQGSLRNPHPDLVTALKKSIDLSRRTGGAFDVTVQPLWKLYARHADSRTLPTEAEIGKVRQRMGWEYIRVEPEIIYFDRPGMQVTLNGVAQGLAADLAQQALEEWGIENALIDAGEFNAIGSPEQRDSWHIGVQHPRQLGSIAKTGLQGRCLSTSGDYASKFSDDYCHHHLLDPRTGLSPVKLSAVSVAAPTALEADSLSTALFVLGPEKAKEMAESMKGVDALFVSKSGDITATDGFPLV
ncbi:MAG TPA: thiamine biosynthesis protein ApbE [Verrucomicrobiales bacterium]|nr:thiamine biosynthesis protein ApbE [Verrucomicrobiales bacterium]